MLSIRQSKRMGIDWTGHAFRFFLFKLKLAKYSVISFSEYKNALYILNASLDWLLWHIWMPWALHRSCHRRHTLISREIVLSFVEKPPPDFASKTCMPRTSKTHLLFQNIKNLDFSFMFMEYLLKMNKKVFFLLIHVIIEALNCCFRPSSEWVSIKNYLNQNIPFAI